MQRRALDVLGETVFLGNAVLAHDAGHGRCVWSLELAQQIGGPDQARPTWRKAEAKRAIAAFVVSR
jgi:hypothetical protein